MKRRDFLKQLAVSGTAGSIIDLERILAQNLTRFPMPLKIGYLPITDASPLLIGYENGFFNKHGIEVAPPVLLRTWPALVEALMTGKVDLIHVLFPLAIWLRYQVQFPVKIFAWNHLNGSALTLGPRSRVRSFADLGGKTIAVPHWYSTHNLILQAGLRHVNLKPLVRPGKKRLSSQEVLLTIVAPTEMPAALAAGKIDGFIVAEPFNAMTELKLGGRILQFTGDIWKNHPCCVLVMKENLIQAYPEIMNKITRAVVESQAWIIQHLNETARLLAREYKGWLPVNQKVLERVFEIDAVSDQISTHHHKQWLTKRIGFQPYPFPSATQLMVDYLKKTLIEGSNQFLIRYEAEYIAHDLVVENFARQAILDLGGLALFPDLNVDDPWQREEFIDF